MATENGMPENEDVKKKALLRLGVAGVITAAALAGLWWLDQGADKAKSAPPKVTSPAPIVPAASPETAPPQTEPAGTETPAIKEVETPASPQPAEAAPRTPNEPPPPPRVSNGTKAPPPPAQPGATPTRAATTTSAPAPPPSAPQAQSQAPAPAQAIPAGKGYVVQLGVFSNPDNAREMVEKLNRQGIRAHLEARVQLGPFLNRNEAEKAQAEMRKLGYGALVTTAYPAIPAR